MELKDLLLTPIFLLIIYGLANWKKKKATDKITKKYFIPALTLKLIGAVSLGLIYQFYYGGGDTFNYFQHIKVLYNAFLDSPAIWLKLMLADGEYDPAIARYSSQMEWYRSPTEYFVAKMGSAFSIISFNTYTVVALFFAFLSFTGMWAMYLTFLKIRPDLHKQFAIAVFFLPSVFFWGSGLMKDSLTLGALGWLFYGFYQGLIEKKKIFMSSIIILLAIYVISSLKVYILLSFLPPAMFWIFNENSKRIKNSFLRIAAKPLFYAVGLGIAYVGATTLTEGDEKYDVDKIGERSKINSEYLSKQVYSGSAYDIGTFDGSISSMLAVGPQAVAVSLYRPFLWEVRNPVMALSALESTFFIVLTIYLIFKTGLFKTIQYITATPIVNFCIIFSIVFAFAVGTNSGNFGTLVRYKIPLMPFYLSALYIMQANIKKPARKVISRSGRRLHSPAGL